MVLLCFDCDGTLSVAGGPIDVEKLKMLEAHGDVKVVIVSASASCTNLPFTRIVENGRVENLRDATSQFPDKIRIYISDNQNDAEVARQANFSYIHPSNFVI